MRKIEEFPEGEGQSKITVEHEDWEVSVITEDGKSRLEFYSRYSGRAKVDSDLLIDALQSLIFTVRDRRRIEAEEARQKALAPVPEALRRACIVGPGTPTNPVVRAFAPPIEVRTEVPDTLPNPREMPKKEPDLL